MTKPHLTRANGYWRCQGQGVDGYGMTPKSAFAQWRAMLPKALRPWVEDERLYPTPVDPMLVALAAWEPTQAH
ncbi:MAG TPA: hypothetical protein VIN03_12050 [Roseateles sp.]